MWGTTARFAPLSMFDGRPVSTTRSWGRSARRRSCGVNVGSNRVWAPQMRVLNQPLADVVDERLERVGPVWSKPDRTVNMFAQQIRMTVVPRVFLQHVRQHPAQ